MSTAVRGFGRAAQQRDDVVRAERALEDLRDDLDALEEEADEEVAQLVKDFDLDEIELEATEIPPRKSDLKVNDVVIVWTPWMVDGAGIASPLFENQ